MYILSILLLWTHVICINGYITYTAARFPLQGERAHPGSPWPAPQTMTKTNVLLTLDPASFSFTSEVDDCDILMEAYKRYRSLIFNGQKSDKDSSTYLATLQVNVKNKQCPAYPDFDMDESYQLDVATTALLSANTVWGALRGLETFSQLVYTMDGQLVLNETHITDHPRFKHRGTMIDTARHFIPMPIILKHLDALSYNKMNVLHWHIVDDQSFPFVSVVFPELSKKGAYSPKHVYSPEDVQQVIEYARLRGIRVIPEFDTPGHAEGWARSFQHLLTACWVNGVPGQAKYGIHTEYENLDPTQNATYDFLSQFFSEVKDVFKDKYLHLGQDEAHYMCWESSPNITAFMKQKGFPPGEYQKLEQYFGSRLSDIISGLDRQRIIWQDPIEHGAQAPPDTLVHVWKDTKSWDIYAHWSKYLYNVTAKGYKVLFSSCWYLNKISYGEDWVEYYTCDPQEFNGTADQNHLVQGGEACMWAEYVDGTNFLSRYWPRASAVAERLWSSASLKNVEDARFRLDQHRCRMVRRGIPAEPILPGFCGDYDVGFPPEETGTPATVREHSTTAPVCTGTAAVAILNVHLLFLVFFQLL